MAIIFFRSLQFFLVATLTLVSMMSQATEKKDQQLYQRYQQHAVNPTGEDTWQSLTSRLQQKSYTILKQDTLWDISKIFFGDPDFWPKIWSLNRDIIFNPHFISPQDILVFDLGDHLRPPHVFLQHTEEGIKMEISNYAGLTPLQAYNKQNRYIPLTLPLPDLGDGVKLPPGLRFPSVKPVPPSMPIWKGRGDPNELVKFEMTEPIRKGLDESRLLLCWVESQSIESVGEVVEIEGDLAAAIENQYVFIKLPSWLPSGLVHVVNEVEQLPNGGYIYQLQAVLEVIQPVSQNNRLYRARVRRSLAHVTKGAKVVVPRPLDYQAQSIAALGTQESEVVSGVCQADAHTFGEGETIFLRSPRSQPLQVGQQLAVYRSEEMRNKKTIALMNPRVIGAVQIVYVSGRWATGIVLDAQEEIIAGDGTAPEYQ